jgi:hypothetical protein
MQKYTVEILKGVHIARTYSGHASYQQTFVAVSAKLNHLFLSFI